MGVSVATSEFPAANYAFSAHTISDAVAPYELVKTSRADGQRWRTLKFLAPGRAIVARMGRAWS